jgi:outer membrane protein assembly factor BamB
VHITVVCPSCQTRYQIDPAYRGVRMRCPNANCRTVFDAQEVVEAPPPPAAPRSRSAPPSGGKAQTGTVGDMVPILPAETVGRAAPPPLAAEPLPQTHVLNDQPQAPTRDHASWRQPPPVRQPDGAGSASRQPAPAAPAPTDPSDWHTAPPPPRQPGQATVPPAAGRQPTPPSRQPAAPPPPRSPRQPPRTRAEEPLQALPAEDDIRAEDQLEAVPAEPSWHQAPPVRRGGDTYTGLRAGETMVAPALQAERAARARGHFSLILSAGILAGVVLIVAVGALATWLYLRGAEDRLAQQARQEYAEGRYPEAATHYQQLLDKFPESASANDYRLFLDLSELRSRMSSATSPVGETLDRADKLIKEHGGDAPLQEQGRDLGSALYRWVREKAEAIPADPNSVPPDFPDRAREVLRAASQAFPGSVTADDLARLDDVFTKGQEILNRVVQRKTVLEEVQKLPATADGIKQARKLIEQQKKLQPDFDQDAEVVAALGTFYDGHLKSVTYTPRPEVLSRSRLAEDREPGMIVNPMVQGVAPARREGDPVVLALVRGVLYALSQSTGDVIWAMRVGIDTASLPVRLPAVGGRPEMVLVVSADTLTLTALDAATGDQLWKYRLSAPCLGQPVVVDLRAYVPTYDGLVHEIELAKGQLLGHYNLGQHLTVGGTRQAGTKLVYFPADDNCVYVLDVAARRCQGILYSGHPSGSLRSAPIIVGDGARDPDADPSAPQGYLVLSQTSGIDTMQLRAFALPIEGGQAVPPAVQTEPTRGWPWFQPYHDPEKLLLVTDAGVVGLFGIRQFRTQDNALFPWVREEIKVESTAGSGAAAGRAQVVLCQGDDLWVLAHGGLQKLSTVLYSASGPRVTVDPVWKELLPLGSPLHQSQVDAAGTTLFVVTQSLTRLGCLATAVDADSKRVRWQRQLGLVCQGEPLTLGGPGVLALDQGGGVFSFDPADHPARADLQWQLGGQSLAKSLDDNPAFRPVLLPGRDGKSAYEVACPGSGTHLVIRRFVADADGRKLAADPDGEKSVELPAAPAGAPAVGVASLLLPLADGTLLRVPLPPDPGGAVTGPDWRTVRGNVAARGFVAWINDTDFLTNDGGRGLTHWTWPFPKTWTGSGSVELTDRARISAPPVVLPGKDEVSVCVATADGVVTLLRGQGLEELRHWELGGKITTAPFVRGGRVGCVVDRRRLVWIDPERQDLVWEYRSPGEEIVGQPQVIEGMLVVADEAGRFVGLDPATGKPRGPGYTLKASVAPAASPVAFGPGRAFAPLTDGTVLLLSLHHLREPPVNLPIVW